MPAPIDAPELIARLRRLARTGMTQRAMAADLGVTQGTVRSWMRRFDVPARDLSEAITAMWQRPAERSRRVALRRRTAKETPELIAAIREMAAKPMMGRAIARDLRIAKTTLRRWCRKHDIALPCLPVARRMRMGEVPSPVEVPGWAAAAPAVDYATIGRLRGEHEAARRVRRALAELREAA